MHTIEPRLQYSVSICSSSAFAVHNLYFILVSLYAFNCLLKRHSFPFSHSITLSSWSGMKMRASFFFDESFAFFFVRFTATGAWWPGWSSSLPWKVGTGAAATGNWKLVLEVLTGEVVEWTLTQNVNICPFLYRPPAHSVLHYSWTAVHSQWMIWCHPLSIPCSCDALCMLPGITITLRDLLCNLLDQPFSLIIQPYDPQIAIVKTCYNFEFEPPVHAHKPLITDQLSYSPTPPPPNTKFIFSNFFSNFSAGISRLVDIY